MTGLLIGEEAAGQTEANLSGKPMDLACAVADDPTVIEALAGKREEKSIHLTRSEAPGEKDRDRFVWPGAR